MVLVFAVVAVVAKSPLSAALVFAVVAVVAKASLSAATPRAKERRIFVEKGSPLDTLASV